MLDLFPYPLEIVPIISNDIPRQMVTTKNQYTTETIEIYDCDNGQILKQKQLPVLISDLFVPVLDLSSNSLEIVSIKWNISQITIQSE